MRTEGTETSVGAYQAKTHLAELLDRVSHGEEIVITRHGSPVARLVPVGAGLAPERRRALIERWMERSKGLTLGDLNIRDLIDEGRR